jgi:hypothetical protein
MSPETVHVARRAMHAVKKNKRQRQVVANADTCANQTASPSQLQHAANRPERIP